MKKWRLAAAGLGGLVILIAGSYLILNPETQRLTPQTRASLPGNYIALSDGITHYDLAGPANGQLVVLVDGFSIPDFTWERNVPALTLAGFRVLTYDLYGRGYSDRPNVVYNLPLFVRQLNELLTALKVTTPVDMVGLSLGGYITAGFANQHPDRVQRVVLMAPQPNATGSDPLLRLVTLPWIGEYLFTIYIGPNAIMDSKNEYDAYVPNSDWYDREKEAFSYVGTRNALLSTLRNMTGDPLIEYRGLAKLGCPVELLWGDQDQTVSIDYATQVKEAIPLAEYHVIQGARHESEYEKPDVVNPLIVDFFTRPSLPTIVPVSPVK